MPATDRAAGDPAAAGPERRAARLAHWVLAMQASADDRVRAAGWLIGMPAGSVVDRDRLATLAASSADPVVQAYAQRVCRSDAASSSACLALPLDAWARVEPDNAAAWLALAADPRADAAQQRGALHQAAAATRFDSHMLQLHPLARAAQPAGIDDGDRLAMAQDIVATRGDWMATEALRLHCNGIDADEADTSKTCGAIAELLQAKAQTLPDLQQVRELGPRLGWNEARREALRDEAARLAAATRHVPEAEDPADCAAAARRLDYLAEVGRVGEIEALRSLIDDGARR